MGRYERIAIELLEAAFGDRWIRDDTRVFTFGPDAGAGEVDGVVDTWIAVEIGVGSPKQVRASLLELALHPYEGKLLVLVDTPGHATDRSIKQAAAILRRLGCLGAVYRIPVDQKHRETALQLRELVDAISSERLSAKF